MTAHSFDYFGKNGGDKERNIYTAFNDRPEIKYLKEKFDMHFDAVVEFAVERAGFDTPEGVALNILGLLRNNEEVAGMTSAYANLAQIADNAKDDAEMGVLCYLKDGKKVVDI